MANIRPLRPQPHRLKWPLTPTQVEATDEMLEMLFKAVRALQITVAAVPTSTPVASTSSIGSFGLLGQSVPSEEVGTDWLSFGDNFQSAVAGLYVPYVGAIKNVDLGAFTLTTPTVIGGTAVGSSLSLQSTSGVGTTDFIKFLVGNAGGTEAARIIDSGFVGLGIAAPNLRLHIRGTASGTGPPANAGTTAVGLVRVNDPSQVTLDMGTIGNVIPFPFWFQVHDHTSQNVNYGLSFQPNGGNVGIGTLVPVAKLSVDGVSSTGPSNTDKGIFYANGFDNSVGLTIGNYTASPFGMWLQATTIPIGTSVFPIVLNPAGGKVGIGVSNPSQILHVVATNPTVLVADAGASFANIQFQNSGSALYYGVDSSTGGGLLSTSTANSAVFNQAGVFDMMFATSNLLRITLSAAGKVAIGTQAPTAVLHLKAGTATADTAPLKFISGTLLGTAEAGAVEFLTDAYYGTITTGAARKTFAFLEAPVFTALSVTGAITSYNGQGLIGRGIPTIWATVSTTGLTANVGATTMFPLGASQAGVYRISAYVIETTAGSISSTLPNVQILYTDKDTGGVITIDATPVLGVAGIGQTGALNANTVGTASAGVIIVSAKASTNIQYQTVNYASTAAGMAYSLYIRLEAL